MEENEKTWIDDLKEKIDTNIKPNNHKRKITGAKLNTTLKEMVDELSEHTPKSLGDLSNQEAGYDSSDPSVFTGKMGYVVLQPQDDEDLEHTSFAAQIADKPNTIFEIRDVFDLGGTQYNPVIVDIPVNSFFKFNGGVIKNCILRGDFNTISGDVDLSCLGIRYNSSNYAESNHDAFSILSQVTNNPKLVMSGDVYIAGDAISLNNLHIVGNNNMIKVDGFNGFEVVGAVALENIRIIAEEGKTGTMNQFIVMSYDDSPMNFEMNGCYASGNLRLCTVKRVSDSQDNPITPTINEIRITHNKFERIFCLDGSNIVFIFQNCNYKKLIIENNVIHNFYCEFIGAGISNGTIHVTNIENFYQEYGRSTIVRNNYAYNDFNFYAWAANSHNANGIGNDNNVPGYFSLIVLEKGKCIFTDNTIKNIIGNKSNGGVYDSYLSVRELYYANNHIENVCNLHKSLLNQIIKSKSGGGKKEYYNNIYITTNLAENYNNVVINDQDGNEVDFDSLYHIIINTAEDADTFILKDNTFNLYAVNLNRANNFGFKNIFIQNNVMNIGRIDVHVTNRGSIFSIGKVDDSIAVIENNIVNVLSSNENLNGVFLSKKTSSLSSPTYDNFHVLIKNNSFKNIIPFLSPEDNNIAIGEITDNSIIVDYSLIEPSKCVLCSNYKNNFDYKNRIIVTNDENVIKNISNSLNNYIAEITCSDGLLKVLGFPANTTVNTRIEIEVYDKTKSDKLLHSELMLHVSENQQVYTVAYTGFNINGQYNSELTSGYWYNFGSDKSVSVYTKLRNIYINGLKEGTYIIKCTCVDIDSSDNYLKNKIKRGSDSTIPTGAMSDSDFGFAYYRNDAKSNIVWDGENWIDKDGNIVAPEPLKFTADENSSTIKIETNGTATISIEYAKNNDTFSAYTAGDIINLDKGDYVLFRRSSNTPISALSGSTSNFVQFVMTGKISASGDIRYLLDKNAISINSLGDYCFYGLFSGCASLITPPLLPVSEINARGCSEMFKGCTSLVSSPIINAKCNSAALRDMFLDCIALTEISEIVLQDYISDSSTNVMYGMFNGCSSLVDASNVYILPNVIYEGCCRNMFKNCSALEYPPIIEATSVVQFGCASMFEGCSALEKSPFLYIETIAYNSTNSPLQAMFKNCEALKEIYLMTLTKLGEGYSTNWITGVPNTGVTFYANKKEEWIGDLSERNQNTLYQDWDIEHIDNPNEDGSDEPEEPEEPEENEDNQLDN